MSAPAPPRDPLGRVYTTERLARQMIAALPDLPAEGRVLLEPSVGGGAILEAARARWPDLVTVGVDIDPHAAGRFRCDHAPLGDWPTIQRWYDRMDLPRPMLIVGNPPFGKKVKIRVTLEHVWACLEMQAPITSLLLPLPYVCAAAFQPVWRARRPSVIRRVPYRPWPDRMREVCIFEWYLGYRSSTIVAELELGPE